MSLSNKTTVELGKDLYGKNCAACHGGAGEGGVGPYLTGKSNIVGMLQAYKDKQTRGPQSAIMWANAQQLSTKDMENNSIDQTDDVILLEQKYILNEKLTIQEFLDQQTHVIGIEKIQIHNFIKIKVDE